MAGHIIFKRFLVPFSFLLCIATFGILFYSIQQKIVPSKVISEEYNSLREQTIHQTYPNNGNKQAETQQFPNYYEDNLRPDWKFQISRNYDNEHLHYWSEPIRNVNIVNVTGQGENGLPYVPSKEEEEPMNQLKKEHNYNVWASDRISLRRNLPDYRNPECLNVKYPVKLPTTSVIIVFHNERWATLLRTVWSIIDRSPVDLLEEIILVDDASTWEPLKRPLDDYIELLPVSVKIVRTQKREGLIRARLIGAKEAKGRVLTFLDAHIECSDGWLQPILSRISNDRSVVVVPQIDSISSADLHYRHPGNIQITGLHWHLIFYWMDVPERERLRTNNDMTAPLRTPTHVGCAFSIDREFFFEIGSYDEAMNIWGSENVELAFRVWLCGGSMEILPCSRVAHLYRISTYSFDGDAERIKNQNNNRVAEVWMDEFKKFYYAVTIASQNVSAGNLAERFKLKKRLQCKNFRWYLENIFPESYLLKEYIMMGELRNAATKKCLDIGEAAVSSKLILYRCHKLAGNQFFAFAKSDQLMTGEESCVGVNGSTVIVVGCSEEDKSQLWNWDSKERWIVHRERKLCMQYDGVNVVLGACNTKNMRAKWNFKSNWLTNKLTAPNSS